MCEIEAGIAIVMETWMQEGDSLEERRRDLTLGEGMSMLCKNREPCQANGVSYGGVALIWRERVGVFKEIQLQNEDKHEVLAAVGTLRGQSRKLAILACYVPPNLEKKKTDKCQEFIAGAVLHIKKSYRDPYIVVTGDFNQWPVEDYLANFTDIRETDVGATRGGRSIDRVFTNFSRSMKALGTLAPLEEDVPGEESRKSDHRVVYFTAGLQRRETFTWETFSYRHYTNEAEEEFKRWIVMHGWTEVTGVSGSNNKANAYQRTLTQAIDRFSPLKTTRRRSDNLPWLDKRTIKMKERRKALFMEEGGKRTARWKEEKARINKVITDRKRGYMDSQRNHLLADNASRNFFRHVKCFSTAKKPAQFHVRTILPNKKDEEVAEILAEFFNKVSREFEALQPHEIPMTNGADLPKLEPFEVAARIKKFRKPKSMVPGDVFPSLVMRLSDFFALLLCNIYNEITETKIWLACWKKEYVTIIPKKTNPEGLEDLRNISCTLLASKIYESYVLNWLKSKVSLRSNQYGGCLLYTSPSPRDRQKSRMPSSA